MFLIGFPNSRWSVAVKANVSSNKVDRTSKNGTSKIQALYNSGYKFRQV